MQTASQSAIGQDALAYSESEIDLDPSKLTPQKNIVRSFYKEVWDRAETRLIPEIFHENFTFRGSLGPVLVGHTQFAEYVRWVTDTLDAYTSDVLGLIEEGNWVAGKLRFHGHHRKPLFGCPPTGEHVWWNGAAIFTFREEKVEDLWVLGDIYGLVARMDAGAVKNVEFFGEVRGTEPGEGPVRLPFTVRAGSDESAADPSNPEKGKC